MKKFTLRSLMSVTLLVFFVISLAQSQNFNLQDESSTGLDPANVSVYTAPYANPKFPADLAYGYSASTTVKGPVNFNLNNPSTLNLIADQSSMDFIAASSYANGVWYGGTYNSSSGASLVTIDKVTGTRTIIGLMGGKSVTGLAYDWTTGVMYALTYESSTTKLYTVDLSNAALTLVGNVGSFLGICLGCTSSGVLYTVSVSSDELISIDKSSGAATIIGAIGFNANYAQDMEYDNSDGTMYYAAYNYTSSPGQGEFRTVNLATGLTTLIGLFQSNAEVTGFCVANTSVGIDNHDTPFSVSVFPNPANDCINVFVPGNDIKNVTLLNNLGQLVFESQNTDKNTVINTSDLERGMYFVVVETTYGKTTKKVAVE